MNVLTEIDRLIATQAELQFAKSGYDEAKATAYGVALLDFMRLHGVELRAIVAAANPPGDQRQEGAIPNTVTLAEMRERRTPEQQAAVDAARPRVREYIADLKAASPPPEAAAAAGEAPLCNRPPAGWYCGLERDHEGPCPAWPVSHETAAMDDPIVGHKTHADDAGGFYHTPLRQSEANELLAHIEREEQERKRLMPDEKTAINLMWSAWYRLKDFGWREACYCPKDGSEFDVLEAGSTGIHRTSYYGTWPTGGYVDVSTPVLFRAALAAPTGPQPAGGGVDDLLDALLQRPNRVWQFPGYTTTELARGIVVDPIELRALVKGDSHAG